MLSLGTLFQLFFMAIIIDFLTGIINAGKQGKLKSRTCSDGMFRTLGELIVLVIFIGVSYYVPDLANYVSVFILGFILKECISIMENLVGLGVELPTALVQTLNVWHEKVDSGEIKKN
jgi:toxin secretion/phage lysis holin